MPHDGDALVPQLHGMSIASKGPLSKTCYLPSAYACFTCTYLLPLPCRSYVLPKGGSSEWRGRVGAAMALLMGSKLLNVQVCCD